MGKTLQALAFAVGRLRAGKLRNVLIICQKTNLAVTWVKEANAILSSCKDEIELLALTETEMKIRNGNKGVKSRLKKARKRTR